MFMIKYLICKQQYFVKHFYQSMSFIALNQYYVMKKMYLFPMNEMDLKFDNIVNFLLIDSLTKLVFSKTCVKRPLKNRHNILMTNGSLMKVESIAECSTWNILQYF